MEHQYNKNPLQEDLDFNQSTQNYNSLPESFTSEDVNLIMQIRAHSCIYCIKKKKNRNEDLENEIKLAWEEIGKNLQMNVSDCQHRWTILRQRFSKERTKRDNKVTLSENRVTIEKFSFYDYMKWLDPYVPRRQKRSAKLLKNNINTSKKLCLVNTCKDRTSNNLALPSTNVEETSLATQPSSPELNMPQLNSTQLTSPEISVTRFKSPQISPSEVTIPVEESSNFLDDLGHKEEISTETEFIEKSITTSALTSTTTTCSASNEKIVDSQQENEDLFNFFEDDDFDEDDETNNLTRTSSQCNSYEIQIEALSNLTNTVNSVLKYTPVEVKFKKNINKEKYKILGQLVESHLQTIDNESYKIEIKANITRILYGKKDHSDVLLE